MSGNSGGSVKAGDLVFAKMKGFPFWPARVCKSDIGYKKRVPVFYFGTHQVGNVPLENVVPYNGNKTKYGSGVRIKGFSEGMWEIQNNPGICGKLKIPEKQPSGKPTALTKAAAKSASPKLTTRGRRTSQVTKLAVSLSKTPTRATRSAEGTLSDDDQKSNQSVAADAETSEVSQRQQSDGKVTEEDGGSSTNEGEEIRLEQSPGLKPRKLKTNDKEQDRGNKRRTRSHGDVLSIDEVQKTKRKRKGTSEVNIDGTEEHSKKKTKTQNISEEERDRTEVRRTVEDSGMKSAVECGGTETPEVSLELPLQGAESKKEDSVQGETVEMVERESTESDDGKALMSDKDVGQKTGHDVGTKNRHETMSGSEELGDRKNEHDGRKTKRGRKKKKSSCSLEEAEQDRRVREGTGSNKGHAEGETNEIVEERSKMDKADVEGERTESADENSESENHDGAKRKTRSGWMSDEMTVDTKTPQSVRARRGRAGKEEDKKTVKRRMTRRDTRPSENEETRTKDERDVGKEVSGSDGENCCVEERKRKKETKPVSGEALDQRKVTTEEKLSEGEGTTTKSEEEGKKMVKDEVTGKEEGSGNKPSKRGRKRKTKEITTQNEIVKTGNQEKGEQNKTEDGQTKRETRSTSEDVNRSRRDEEIDVVLNRREKKRETNDEKSESDEARKPESDKKLKKRKKTAETGSDSEHATKVTEEDGSEKGKDKVMRAVEETISDIAEVRKEERLKKTAQDERSGEDTQPASKGPKRRRKEVDKKCLRAEEQKRNVSENWDARGKPEKHRDEERQALKRERLLKSLQGLLKSKRGSRKRESVKSLQKAADSRKKSIKNLTSKRKHEKRGRKPGVKTQQEKAQVAKEAEGKEEKSDDGQMTDEPKGDEKEVRLTDEKSDGTRQDMLEERKAERKIIGKIVKAGQGGKIQLKTMMGGIMASSEKKKDEKLEAAETTGLIDKEAKVERKGSSDIIGKLEKNIDGKRRLLMHDGKEKGRERDKSTNQIVPSGEDRMATREPKRREKAVKEEERITAETERGAREAKKENRPREKLEKRSGGSKTGDGRSTESDERMMLESKQSSPITPTDSTLHRIHGDIRISLKSDKPDIHKCLEALDQLSAVYVTSQHIKRHSELIATLRKMRHYRASQTIMDKASMLYNRFKNAYLVGEGEEVVSAAFLRSLIEEKEREEEKRVELLQHKETAVCQEVEGVDGDIEKGSGTKEERLNEQQLVEVEEL
ncbi:hepatoma-derived growth factor-related protein 2 isoform X2 [Synchiropus splendidus]|nr:hepatoma-derived growth factor-related protein 2 isoform X2 [Synchiropus splendidus]